MVWLRRHYVRVIDVGVGEDALFVPVWSVFISHLLKSLVPLSSCSQPPFPCCFSLCTFSFSLRFMMPSEQPPSNATDIFSLSDRVLADKLQFVKEVRFSIKELTPNSSCIPFRLALGTGAVFGYADQECQTMPATLNWR